MQQKWSLHPATVTKLLEDEIFFVVTGHFYNIFHISYDSFEISDFNEYWR